MNKKNETSNSVKHIVSLVLGIISIVFCAFWYITLPTSIIAITFGTQSYKRNKSKLGLAGLITGIVGIALFAFIYITFIMLIILNNSY